MSDALGVLCRVLLQTKIPQIKAFVKIKYLIFIKQMFFKIIKHLIKILKLKLNLICAKQLIISVFLL
jgi:hypothetical protein